MARPGRSPGTWLIATAMLIALVTGWLNNKAYLLLDEETIGADGYASQVAFIRELVDGGGNLFDVEPLYWIQGLRTAIAVAFEVISSIGGPGLTAAVILCALAPLFDLFQTSKRPYLLLLLPFTLIALSYRAVLVYVAIGYLFLYILKRPSSVYLALSFLLANLSSGGVLSALLIAFLIGRAYRKRSLALRVYMISLFLSLGISAWDKYLGFVNQDTGYDATVQGATGLAALLSRSTIFVSFLNGDYLRGVVYVGLLLVALYAFFSAVKSSRYKGYAVVFLTTVPTFMLEGLGVISLLVPVLMFFAGVPLALRHVRTQPHRKPATGESAPPSDDQAPLPV